MRQNTDMKLSKTLSAIFIIVLFIPASLFLPQDVPKTMTTHCLIIAMIQSLLLWTLPLGTRFLVGSEKYHSSNCGKIWNLLVEGVKGYGESYRLGCFLITTSGVMN